MAPSECQIGQNEPSPEAVDADNQDVEPTATDQEESEASARVGPSTDETEAEHPPDDPNSNQSAQVELDAEVPTSPSYAHGGEEELGSSPLSPVDDDEDEPPSSGLSEPETTPAVAARRRPPRRVRKIGKAKKRAKPKPKPNGKQDPFAEGGTLGKY